MYLTYVFGAITVSSMSDTPAVSEPMFECDRCGERNVPAKRKGHGYYCDSCFDEYIAEQAQALG